MNYKVLIGFFNNREKAEYVLSEMIQKDIPGAVREHDGVYSILITEYENKQDALLLKEQLLDKGFSVSVSYE